ncbi:MAG TPA: ABC transporter ATP-binding protein [bacterium]|nr:ABC transporter ATP-binding protein [bacterium]
MADYILSVSDLTARYGDEDILKGVSITVPRGSIVALLGPNGSGKSTLLKAIYGLVVKRTGTVHFHSRTGQTVDLMRLKPNEVTAHGVNMVPQLANVFPELSVYENLEIGVIRERTRTAERMERVLGALPLLRALLRRRAATLSGGQRQALGIARALMSNPELLILDEPSAGLAPQVVDEVFQQVRAINQNGVSILVVEQKARQCLAVADYGYVLDQGRNQIDGPSAQLLADPEMVRLYLGARRRRTDAT